MKKEDIRICCANDGSSLNARLGMTLGELARKTGHDTVADPRTGVKEPVLAALVDHILKPLDFPLVVSHEVQFIGYSHADGRRCYLRSLCFVLQKAVRDLFPDKFLVIDHSLPSGYYCALKERVPGSDGHHGIYFIRDEELEKLKARMEEIIAADLPFTHEEMPVNEAEKIFNDNFQPFKAALQRSLGHFFCTVWFLDGCADSFHGPLVPSTGFLKIFDLTGFSNGFILQPPTIGDASRVMPMKRQSKIAAALESYSNWCEQLKIIGVGTLNNSIMDGQGIRLINLAEARHERDYAAIADQIAARRGSVRVILLAGPSSSGKTSSSLRLALQCKVLGLNPKVIELDNYFVDREHTPKDENGAYDFESLHAMDLELLNRQINELLAGKEVTIPRFDFKQGCRAGDGTPMRLEDNDILIMEGIHALNPEMVSAVDPTRVFRVYVSALTSLNIDENNNISTSDNRLLRRIVRDNRVRGITPEDTLLRWHSVRRGEMRNIFPFQENADAVFNSALLFELPMLKYYAEPLLLRILPNSPAYPEAQRLLKFLSYIIALQPAEIAAIPPTSIMREFIGGQTL